MFAPLTYLRKAIPHSSPIRLWYTRMKNFSGALLVPTDTNGIQIIGVTGTDGKTTTVEMVSHILTELNVPHISASSYAIKHNGKVLSMSKRTTGSAYAVHKLLQKAKEENVRVVVLEASSHSFVQWRLWGVVFEIAVLTNITHEHLNFHKTIKNYAAAKKLLFTKYLKPTGTAILPTNDTYGKKWIEEFAELAKKSSVYSTPVPYSPEKSNAITDTHGTAFIYNEAQYSMPMPGDYNAGNAIAAALAVSTVRFNLTVEQCLDTMTTFSGIPGRMQRIPTDETAKQGLVVIVDFALTEKAMVSALATAQEIAQNNKACPNSKAGRVIVVFGASGGQHDASVHPGLAKAAASGADIAIVTDDEPYDGDPAELRANLIKNIEKTTADNTKLRSFASKFEYYNIADRREAIAKALSLSNDGDVVIVTGMGHYTSRTIAGKEIPWSDVKVITEELSKL